MDKSSNSLERKGARLVEIDRWFPSSKLCSNCFYQVSEMLLDVREWNCPHCNTHHDRDENAARNIRAEGIRLIKAEGDARSPLASPLGRRLANAALSAVSAVGGEVSPNLGRKSKFRHSPVITEAPSSAVGN